MDRLVAKKRELIERLKEKRTALISRTVTRGLPPAAARAAGLPENPPLKPSGLDWLGDIPKHWEVKKFVGSACSMPFNRRHAFGLGGTTLRAPFQLRGLNPSLAATSSKSSTAPPGN